MNKNKLLFVLIFIFFSCGNSKNGTPNNEKEVLSELTDTTKLDTSWSYFMSEVEQHYISTKDTSLVFESEIDEERNVKSTIGRERESGSIVSEVNIPIENSLVFGDLDSDGINEYLIEINCASGGSASWNEVLLFKLIDNHYKIVSVKNNTDLAGCSNGEFFINEISKGKVRGTSRCWTNEDAHCCPSLEYDTEVMLEGDNLKFLSNSNKRPYKNE